MAVAVETKIMEALFDHVAALTLTPAHPVSLPRMPFTPPDDGKWLRVNEFKLPTVLTTLAHQVEFGGLLIVDVMWPAGPDSAGARGPMEIAGAVASHFKRGTLLTREGISIRTVKADVRSPLSDPPRYQIPVSVQYRCFASVA